MCGDFWQTTRVSRANLDKDPSEVAAMFDAVAAKYDLTNDILAVGQTRRWRSAVRTALQLEPGHTVLDIAAGTGTSSAAFTTSGASVIAADFSLGMLEVGKGRNPEIPFVAADALALPFADSSFDRVTISFGLRNVADRMLALEEFRGYQARRVTRSLRVLPSNAGTTSTGVHRVPHGGPPGSL